MLIKTSAFDLCGKYKDALSLETSVCELEVTRGCRYQRDIRIRKFSGKSCAKTILVHVFKKDHPQNSLKLYAIIDDQCNRSLAGSGFFDHFCVNDGTAANALSSGVGALK